MSVENNSRAAYTFLLLAGRSAAVVVVVADLLLTTHQNRVDPDRRCCRVTFKFANKSRRLYIYIYIYIERERERSSSYSLFVFFFFPHHSAEELHGKFLSLSVDGLRRVLMTALMATSTSPPPSACKSTPYRSTRAILPIRLPFIIIIIFCLSLSSL